MWLLLLALGVALAGWGTVTALAGRRPLDLVAAFAAALGVTLAVAGTVALLVPGFFS